jgi:O-antigen/teichoic acid export membrane protein
MPAYTYTVILMAALIVPLVQNTGILILQAKNKHAFRAIVFVIIAILNVCISIPLAKQYGAMACACVTAGCLVLGQGLILNIYYAKLGVKIIAFFGHIGKIFLAMLLPIGLTGWMLTKVSLSPSIPVLGAQIMLFTVLYGLTLWIFAMNTYEKNLILTPLKKVLNK